MLLFKLILDDLAVKQTFKAFKELKFTNDSVAIIEGSSQDRGQSAFEFLNALAELVEIIIKFAHLDIHNIIVDKHEFIFGGIELIQDVHNRTGHGLALSVTDFNLSKLVELLDSAGKVHNVLTSLREGVKADKKGVSGNFPLVLALCLVIEVGLLEFGANIDAFLQTGMSFLRNVTFNSRFYSFTINEVMALNNNSVADLADQDHKSGGSVVEFGVSPNHENSVHDRNEKVSNIYNFLRCVSQVPKEAFESL